jgi:hypothetical protein
MYVEADDLVITVGDGEITSDDLRAFAHQQITDPRWPFETTTRGYVDDPVRAHTR